MKYSTGLSIGLLLGMNAFTARAQQVTNPWENPAVQTENAITPHASFIPSISEAAALAALPSPLVNSLDGVWKFKLAPSPALRPDSFYLDKYDVRNWSDITVPAHWQTAGFDKYIFTDVEYPIPVNPPYPPQNDNPVGSYRRNFTISPSWTGKQVFLRFGAVNSFFYCWINGQYVGFSKDSKTAAEFDITAYLRKGENNVSVQVFRFSDATYLEGQDMWKLSGIERSVQLIARSPIAVQDFFVKATLDSTYTKGLFNLDVQLNKAASGGRLQIKLLDDKGQTVLQQQGALTGAAKYHFEGLLSTVKNWNAESPHLYTLLITQYDKKGKLVECIAHKTGFRTVEIRNGLLLVNGVAVKIKGVNRHEHNMYTGKVITVESMKEDLQLMKQYYINAVRTSHYPNSPEWYRLCDEYGIYVVDEANIECDGMAFHADKTLSDKPLWKQAYLHRTQRMFESNKNHCSIITWSLGNESAFGENFIATYQYLKSKDDSRPVQYEGAGRNEFTDIVCPMYKSPNVMLEYVKEWRNRPFIQCEYAHMMGNGGGNLKAYWDLIYKYPQLQGGFIWDFSDQTFKKKDKAGNAIWAYGRDMGNVGATSDTSYCADGLFAADRTPHPQAFEFKKVIQPVGFEPVALSANSIRLINRLDFTNLDQFTFSWFIKANGIKVAGGVLEAGSLAPHDEKTISLPLPVLAPQPGVEYFLTVAANTRYAGPVLPAGELVAWEQFRLPVYQPALPSKESNKIVSYQDKGDQLSITDGDFEVQFNRTTGWLQSYTWQQQSIMASALEPHFWRAATDNDIGNSQQIRCAVWKDVLQTVRFDSMQVTKTDGQHIIIRTWHYLPAVKAVYKATYTIAAGGEIQVAVAMITGKERMPELPRFGMRLLLQGAFDQVSWLGRGPFDNYADRNTAAAVDVYSMNASQLFHPYPRAQESGYRTEVRWMKLVNGKGIGLMAQGNPLISTGVLHFNMDRLEFDRHAPENNHGGSMTNEDKVWWNIDYKQMGIGGDNSWGATPHAEYWLPYQDYQYSFTLRPTLK
jgi:beta-galactosidase